MTHTLHTHSHRYTDSLRAQMGQELRAIGVLLFALTTILLILLAGIRFPQP